MRLLLPLCSFLFLPLTLSAQAVLHSNEMLPFGSVMELWPSGNSSVVIDTTIQGADVVWDFSELDHWTTNNPDLDITVVDPATTPYAAAFPTANYAWAEAPNTAYRYFNLSSSNLQRVGSRTWTLNIYNNPQIEMVYPMQLGTTNTDPWDNSLSTTGGTYTLRCVGTGTLILPTGTYEDALMVRAWVTEGDYDPYLAFFWYSSINGALLVQHMGQYMAEFDIWYPDTYHLHSLSTGVDEFQGMEVLGWQNPVTDAIQLQTRSRNGGRQPWRLIGLTGQVMDSGTFQASGGVDRWTIPVSDLAVGLYVLCIGEAEEAVSLRVVKE